jgi:hypothetical protein
MARSNANVQLQSTDRGGSSNHGLQVHWRRDITVQGERVDHLRSGPSLNRVGTCRKNEDAATLQKEPEDEYKIPNSESGDGKEAARRRKAFVSKPKA